MRLWEWVLYGVAALWAVRCLVALMAQHALRQRYELRVALMDEMQRKQAEELAAAAAEAQAQQPPATVRTGANPTAKPATAAPATAGAKPNSPATQAKKAA